MNSLIKILVIGILSALILFICGFLTGLDVFTLVSGIIGLICLLISGLFSGVFISGDKIRANTSTENNEERVKRIRNMYAYALIGFPNFLAAISLIILH
jgi:hypothetical protein